MPYTTRALQLKLNNVDCFEFRPAMQKYSEHLGATLKFKVPKGLCKASYTLTIDKY